MGAIGDLKSASMLAKVVLVCLFVANLFNGIAFTTTSWGEQYSVFINGIFNPALPLIHTGLWRICTSTTLNYALLALEAGGCGDLTGTAADWFAAVQALACIGFGGIVGAFILVLVYVLKSKDNDQALIAAIICIVTGVLYLIGIIIFGVNYNRFLLGAFTRRDLSWSYGLAIVSIILEIVSGVLLIVDSKKGGSTSPA